MFTVPPFLANPIMDPLFTAVVDAPFAFTIPLLSPIYAIPSFEARTTGAYMSIWDSFPCKAAAVEPKALLSFAVRYAALDPS